MGSGAVDLKSLVIIKEKFCWCINVDITVRRQPLFTIEVFEVFTCMCSGSAERWAGPGCGVSRNLCGSSDNSSPPNRADDW